MSFAELSQAAECRVELVVWLVCACVDARGASPIDCGAIEPAQAQPAPEPKRVTANSATSYNNRQPTPLAGLIPVEISMSVDLPLASSSHSSPVPSSAQRAIPDPTPTTSTSPNQSPTIFVSYGPRSVKARVDREVPLAEIIRQLAGEFIGAWLLGLGVWCDRLLTRQAHSLDSASSQLGITEPAALFALREKETGTLVTDENLLPFLDQGLSYVSPAGHTFARLAGPLAQLTTRSSAPGSCSHRRPRSRRPRWSRSSSRARRACSSWRRSRSGRSSLSAPSSTSFSSAAGSTPCRTSSSARQGIRSRTACSACRACSIWRTGVGPGCTTALQLG